MNRAEKYVYKVCQTKSFSIAAKELFVSQPALSIAIKRLEEELGYEIFNRKNSPVTLTAEGELYIEYLEETLQTERNLKERIALLREAPSKKLSIGGHNSASYYVLPKICGEFYKRFPNASLKIDVGRNIFDKLEQGIIDLAIHTDCDFSRFDAVNLWNEKYAIVMRKDYPGAEKLEKFSLTYDEILSDNIPEEKEITDLTLLKNIAFFKPGPNSNAWKRMPHLMEECGNTFCRTVNFNRMDICYNLMLEGLGAIIVPYVTILENPYKKDMLHYFSLGIENNTRQAMIIYKKNATLSKVAQEFINLSLEMFGTREKLFKHQ